MRIVITRHGETEENRARTLMGHLPGILSELGKKQARKLAERLKNEKIDLIISSDLARAFDTAKVIAKFHPDVSIKMSKDLRERNLGELQGKRFEEKGHPNRFTEEIFDNHGESRDDLITRAKNIINELIESQVENVLLVGHNGINKALIGVLTGKSAKDTWNIENQGNTSVTIFEGDRGDVKLKLLNCVRHLDEKNNVS